MQTFTLQVQDSFIPNLFNILEQFQDKVIIQKDKNLEYDPFFYERKEELEQIIKECENGSMELLSQEQYDKEMEKFFEDLKVNANI